MPKAQLHTTERAGVLMVELIMSMAVFVIFASGAIYFLSASLVSARTEALQGQAAAYLQAGVEAVQGIDHTAWNYLADSPDNTYGLAQLGGVWTLASDPDHPNSDTHFTRTITVTDVYRNTTNDIVDSSATGATLDPHTRLVTVQIDWSTGATRTSSISAPVYLTDWNANSTSTDTVADWNAGTKTNLRVSSIDDGELQIIQHTLETGTVIATTSWQTVTLSNTYTSPVVVASIKGVNNPNSPVTVRVKNASSNTFQIKLLFPTDNFVPVTTNSETVNYMVVEKGKWTLGDGNIKVEAGIVSNVSRLNCTTCGSWNNGTDITYQHSYAANPLIFHQIVTDNDPTWVTSAISDDTSATSPPGTDGFQVALDGAQVVTTHAAENIAYVVIEQEKTSSFENVKFETDYTGSTIRGYTDAHRSENFDQTYSSAPWTLVSQMSMANTDGSWAMIDTVSATKISLYSDEDQKTDTERSHVNEYGGYMAFASVGTYYLNDAAVVYDAPPMEVGIVQSTATGHMEVGTATATTSWSTITLTNTYTKPVVIAAIVGKNNPNSPVSTRVKSAAGNSFQLRLDFPTDNFAPKTTNSETVNYMVVEAGVWTMGDTHIKVEANIVPNVATVNCFKCGTWNKGTQKAYTNGYTANPMVLHQVMSENSSSWISSFISNSTDYTSPPGTNGFRISLNGADVTKTHAAEDIGYVVIETEKTDSSGGTKFETDTTSNVVRSYDDARYTEAFDQAYTTTPIILVSQNSMRGTEGAWGMIDSAGTSKTTLSMYVDEDQTADTERSHQGEYFSYTAFAQASSFTLTDQTFLQNPVTVTLHNTYTNPVVITTPLLTNDTNSPVSTRVYNVTSNSFTMKLDFPTDKFTPINTSYSNNVNYLVMEAGQWEIGDMKIEAHVDSISSVGHTPAASWVGTTKTFNHYFDNPPAVLHQVMSLNDSSWITTWASQVGTRTNSPTRTQMQLGLNSAQVTTSNAHTAESVGWIAFENVGTSSVDGVEFRTYRPDEFARGHDDGCTSYTHGGTFSNPVAFVSQMSMDGVDGSWATLCSQSSTTEGVQMEEDQYSDTERSHEDEALGMLFFDAPFAYAGAVNTSDLISGTFTSPVIGDGTTERNFNILDWAEQANCASCDIQIKIRTGASLAAVASATYVGPDGTDSSYYDAAVGDLLPLNQIGDKYAQYFVTMTGSTAASPKLYDATLTYYAQ